MYRQEDAASRTEPPACGVKLFEPSWLGDGRRRRLTRALMIKTSCELIDQLVHLGSRGVVLLLLSAQNVGEAFDGAGEALYQRDQVI